MQADCLVFLIMYFVYHTCKCTHAFHIPHTWMHALTLHTWLHAFASHTTLNAYIYTGGGCHCGRRRDCVRFSVVSKNDFTGCSHMLVRDAKGYLWVHTNCTPKIGLQTSLNQATASSGIDHLTLVQTLPETRKSQTYAECFSFNPKECRIL